MSPNVCKRRMRAAPMAFVGKVRSFFIQKRMRPTLGPYVGRVGCSLLNSESFTADSISWSKLWMNMGNDIREGAKIILIISTSSNSPPTNTESYSPPTNTESQSLIETPRSNAPSRLQLHHLTVESSHGSWRELRCIGERLWGGSGPEGKWCVENRCQNEEQMRVSYDVGEGTKTKRWGWEQSFVFGRNSATQRCTKLWDLEYYGTLWHVALTFVISWSKFNNAINKISFNFVGWNSAVPFESQFELSSNAALVGSHNDRNFGWRYNWLRSEDIRQMINCDQ